MKILFLAARDSANFAGIKMIKEFIAKGHEVLVYDKSLDDVNIRMFKSNNIMVRYFDELTDEVVSSCDIMFCHTTYIGDPKIKDKIYTFFFNHIFVYGHENNSDFVFVQSYDKYNPFPNKVVMKIGSPKFDRVYNDYILPEDSSRILFIETGHFPFGIKGREQVAKLILKICNEFPEYTITVKPRYLLTDTKKLTRRNTDHIYNYIFKLCGDNLPENLELLQYHCDLEEMIYKSRSIICYASSSYLEAALSGRGVIYVDGIESVDCIGDRQDKYWKAFNEYIQDTGIIVPYDEVTKYLPDGLKCSEKHLKKAVYSKENVTKKVVEVTEFVWENFISKGIYPKPGEYEYNTYKEELMVDTSLTKQRLIVNNKYDVLVYECQKQEQEIGANLDFSYAYNLLNEWKNNGKIERSELKTLIKDIKGIINDIILRNLRNLNGNKIDQTILFRTLYETNNLNLILNIEHKDIIAKDAFCYYTGLFYCSVNEHERGLLLLDEYFEYAKRISYDETFLYYPESLIKAFTCAFVSCAERDEVKGKKKYLQYMHNLANDYNYDVLNYDMRCARVCYKKELYDAVLLLVENWLKREREGIQLYRILELDAEAYRYKSEIAKINNDLEAYQVYMLKIKQIEKEKQNLISEDFGGKA